MEFLLKVGLERDSLLVLVSDFKDLLDGSSIRGDKAWTEVENAGVEFDTRLSCLSRQHKVVSRSRNDSQSALVVREVMLCDGQVVDLDCHFRSLLNGASIGSDGNILIDLTLPDKVEVELTVVSQCDTLGLLLIDEEIAEVEFVWLSSFDFTSLFLFGVHTVMDLVAFSFDVENKWSGLPLDVANEIIVVSQLVLRHELDLDWQRSKCWYSARHGHYL